MNTKPERAQAYELIRMGLVGHRWPLRAMFTALLGMLTYPLLVTWLREVTRETKLECLPAAGNCLRPWVTDGDLLLFARSLEARPRDLVVHSTLVEIRAGLGTAGRTLTLLGAKHLKLDGVGRPWLTSADGAYRAGAEHAVIGPVVAVVRLPGLPWRRRPPLTGINFPIRPVTP